MGCSPDWDYDWNLYYYEFECQGELELQCKDFDYDEDICIGMNCQWNGSDSTVYLDGLPKCFDILDNWVDNRAIIGQQVYNIEEFNSKNQWLKDEEQGRICISTNELEGIGRNYIPGT